LKKIVLTKKLLGRSINLSRLIGQRITSMLQKSLKITIEKFESGDLTGIIVLLLNNTFLDIFIVTLIS
jgi:hypothetical protein